VVVTITSLAPIVPLTDSRYCGFSVGGTSFFEAFKVADDLLRQAVQGISDIINTTGAINRDFADIKASMIGMGYAMMGTAIASGENAAVEAARQAINCPLLEDTRIAGSRSMLINITGSSRLGFHEVNEACSIIRGAAECDDVQINFGVILNEAMGDSVKITVIATGFQPEGAPVADRRSTEIPIVRLAPRPSEPEPVAAMEPEPDPVVEMPLAAAAEPEPMIDLEDLDTPAYLRQGRLLN
jgi:cell division protein FtsZ